MREPTGTPCWTWQNAFGLIGLREAEMICLGGKAWRRDMAGSAPLGHGKEPQRSTAGKSAGIVSTVRAKAL